jgi:hypothetical protein
MTLRTLFGSGIQCDRILRDRMPIAPAFANRGRHRCGGDLEGFAQFREHLEPIREVSIPPLERRSGDPVFQDFKLSRKYGLRLRVFQDFKFNAPIA